MRVARKSNSPTALPLCNSSAAIGWLLVAIDNVNSADGYRARPGKKSEHLTLVMKSLYFVVAVD